MQKKALLVILGLLIFGIYMNTPRVYASAGVTVAAGSSNGNVYVYDEAGSLLWSYYTGADVASVAVSSDGGYIAVGSLGNKLFLFARDGTKLWEKSVLIAYGGAGRGQESKSVAISAHGEYVVAGCTDKLYVYRKDGTLHWSHAGKETCVGISPNGNYIVACEKYGDVHLFSLASSTPLWTESISAFWVATSNPGYVVASSSNTVYLFDNTGAQLWSYKPPEISGDDYVRVDMPQDGLTAVAANDDPGNAACYLWYFDLNGLVWNFTPCPPEHDFYSMTISADGNIIAMGPGPMGGIYIFSRDGTSLQNITTGDIHSVDLTSDGGFGACGDRAGKLWYFSKDSSTPLWSKTIGGNVYAVAVATYLVEEWPMFHHDLRHTGYSTSTAPNTNNIIWTHPTGGGVSSPAVADGKVYVGSDDKNVYGLDAFTGAKIWNYSTGSLVESSPAVAYGKVFVGSKDDKVYCLNALTGAHIWNRTTGLDVRSSPAVADGKVYVGSRDGNVYCLDASTGDIIWYYPTGGEVRSSPAVADGKVYVGSNDDKVYCLPQNDPNGDGIIDSTEVNWARPTGDNVESSPAVADGKVYVGSADGKVYCLNASTGDIIWNPPTGGHVWSSPAVAYDRVFVGSESDYVYCLDASTGATIWKYNTGQYVSWSSPAVADGKVYVGSIDKNVYCLDALAGTPQKIWQYATGGSVWSSPAVAYGRVYIESYDGKLYAFGPPTYTLTVTTTTGGTTNPSPATYTYAQGTTVAVTATPSANYKFDHWELDGSWDHSNPISITMYFNYTLHAVFKYSPPPPVGGIRVPVDKLGLLAPYIGLASTIVVATAAAAIYVKRVKRRKKKQ